MQQSVHISFQGLDRSEDVEQNIREHAAKLHEFCNRITSCHVVLAKPHAHHQHGNVYHVRIRVAVPKRELVADREPGQNHAHEDPYVAIRDAFKAIRRQLEDYVREIRGDVKAHAKTIRPRATTTLPEIEPAGDRLTSDGHSSPVNLPPSPETIRLRAYEKWEAAGHPAGDSLRFWLEAERELACSH